MPVNLGSILIASTSVAWPPAAADSRRSSQSSDCAHSSDAAMNVWPIDRERLKPSLRDNSLVSGSTSIPAIRYVDEIHDASAMQRTQRRPNRAIAALTFRMSTIAFSAATIPPLTLRHAMLVVTWKGLVACRASHVVVSRRNRCSAPSSFTHLAMTASAATPTDGPLHPMCEQHDKRAADVLAATALAPISGASVVPASRRRGLVAVDIAGRRCRRSVILAQPSPNGSSMLVAGCVNQRGPSAVMYT